MEENPNTRLLALSDGVIAVAITLLVLDIRLPEGFGEFTDAELWGALVALWPRLLAYLLSFLVIGIFWMNHRAKFDEIVKSDAGLTRINMIFLLTIGLVPFTTNLIAESGGTLATAVYAGTMVVSGLALAWLWEHAWRNRLTHPKLSRDDHLRRLWNSLLVSLVFALSVPLSVVHADLAKYFWMLIVPVNFVMRFLAVQRWKRTHPGEPVPQRLGRHSDD